MAHIQPVTGFALKQCESPTLPFLSEKKILVLFLLVQAGEEKYSHLDPAEVGKVEKAITEKTEWYNRSAIPPPIVTRSVADP
jgi:hypothetical protein